MAEEVSGVELRDIASGKLSRVVPLASGGYNILRRGTELPENSASRKPCRAIIVPSGGTLTVTGLDGVDVLLPDPGGAWEWVCQYIAIVGGTATDVVVLW